MPPMKIRHIAMDQGAESMAPLSLRVHRRGLVTELTLEEATPGVTEDTSGSVGKLRNWATKKLKSLSGREA